MSSIGSFLLAKAGVPPTGGEELFPFLLGFAASDPLVITQQPEDVTVSLNETASFSVTADGGAGDLGYQWKYRTTPSGAWINVSADSGKTANYSLTAKARHDGYQYKCVVTDGKAIVATKVVTLTVTE